MDLRNRYIEYLEKARVNEPETYADYTESALGEFIRTYIDSDFKGIYEVTIHRFYDEIRLAIPRDASMKSANLSSGGKISNAIKMYSQFLQSKYFPQPKRPTKKDQVPKPEQPSVPPKPKERELTEGEKKHVKQEREVVKRNPLIRQACIDKYGYQCQCCGMNFTDFYGEELGSRFIEVHHMKMISTYDDSLPDDYVENLVPLCSNCHSMIHHGPDGPLTLTQLREAYHGPKKEILIWKED